MKIEKIEEKITQKLIKKVSSLNFFLLFIQFVDDGNFIT